MPTPIGNLEDLSFRALKRLSEAEVFFCEDTRVTKKLLSLLKDRFNARFQEDAIFVSLHSHNETDRLTGLEPATFEKACVYVSDAGMPAISDPGAKLVAWCLENNVTYEVLPGANAALTAYAASGELSGRFLFYGFLPHKAEARKNILDELAPLPYAVIFYEAPHRIDSLIELLGERLPDRKVSVFKELSKLHEKHFCDTAMNLSKRFKNENLKGEWVTVLHPDNGNRQGAEPWLIEALLQLQAPSKPLSKILAKLTGENAGHWYNRLTEQKREQ